jgi:hypothetical protein
MILGHKPSAYVVHFDRNGKKIEEETRQCVHCSYEWVYRPGSRKIRGFCLKCYGVVCGRDECCACKR